MSRKEKTYHFIYKTTDTRNGNFYYGMHSTDNLNDGYIGSGTRLRKLIYKHGKEIFNMEILEYLPDRSSLKKREEEIVNSDLLKEEKCLNLKPGGYGGFNNEEHRKKFFDIASKDAKRRGLKGLEALAKLMENPEWKENQIKKQSEGLKNYLSVNNKKGMWDGKSHTNETKKLISDKLSKLRKGENNTQFGTCWITNGIENKKIKKEQDIPLGWEKGRNLIKKSC